MAGFELFPEQFHKVLHTTVGRRVFEIGATIVLGRFAVLEIMYLLMHLLHASMESRTPEESLD